MIDILEVFPSLRLPLDVIVQKCSTIMPRYYTIASSSLMHPTDLHIAVSLSEIDVKNDKVEESPRLGLVSAWLKEVAQRKAEK